MSQTAKTPTDIALLADSLTASANELHARVLRAINKNSATHEEAQALFDKEVALRLQANTLYTNAVALSARELAVPRQHLLDLAAQARETIRKIERMKTIADIAGDLLSLAAAVASARPEDLAPAAESLKANLAALKDSPQA
ncbi:hypothetical protein [Massilia endophytica]|uniref:hypothetical protein n=1 Tax=Massilia endophytica TaxID=2899220 RepID=UPI001E560044|nr:hypothetical protein [Massilia endophytica]UGQ47873.1 hypothetical protein LSQ66_05235 [Massilia endophytica]